METKKIILSLLLLLLLAGCKSEGAFSASNAKSERINLERIDIVASPIATKGVSQMKLAMGNKQRFEAIGYYSDGSSHVLTNLRVTNWHSSDPKIGHFDKAGVLSGAKLGTITVKVTKDGITSNPVNVNVSAAVITSIQVTPSPVNVAKGQTQQLTATATFSDATSSNVSNSVTWIPVDKATATVSSTGLLSAVDAGSTTLTATKDGVTSNIVDVNASAAFITSIQVMPSLVAIAKGQTQQLTATATFSDATSSDVSNSVTWTSVDTATATVSSTGVLSAIDAGSTTLTATKDGLTSNAVDVNVSPAVITSIQVAPSPVNLAKGQTQQLTATATFSDGTTTDVSNSATWTPADTATAIVSSTGLLSAVDARSTTLKATKDGVTSNTVDVNVSAAVITSIHVTPSPVNVTKGQTQQLTATATFSDATSFDVSSSVTWTSDNTSTATVSSTGVLSAVDAGNTTLTATKDSVTSNAVNVNVSAATITSIQVTPSTVNIVKGQTQQLTAMATFSDATSFDVSNSVTWTPVDKATVTVSSTGLLSAVDAGSTTLTSTKDGVTSNTVNISVCDLLSNCIDILDLGGKLFTSSPSLTYLNSNGGAADGKVLETGQYGPRRGDFGAFTWNSANALCAVYNINSLEGRTNWRLATSNELHSLLRGYGDMFKARGWPTTGRYWSGTRAPGSSDYFAVSLINGLGGKSLTFSQLYVSCVSEP